MPKVSIILPSYNHNQFLEKRLSSILNQSYSNWELIIIDDASTDGSIKTLKEFSNTYKNKIANLVLKKENSGSGYNSWREGIELAKSEYIWIAETDDYSHSSFLEEQINILENNKNVSLSFSASNYVDVDENFLYDSSKRTRDLSVNLDDYGVFTSSHIISKMPFDTYITNGSSVLFRNPNKALPEALFRYKQISDQFLWTYLIESKSVAFLNKNLNYFRRHEDSTTHKVNVHDNINLYKEIIAFLNFFQLSNRTTDFLDYYIKHYVWSNKKQMFNTSLLIDFEDVKRVKRKYYSRLLNFIFSKVFKKKCQIINR